MQKVPHLEGLSSNYSKLFRVVYKGSLADAEVGEDVLKGIFTGYITHNFSKSIGAGMKVEGDEVARSALCDALFLLFRSPQELVGGLRHVVHW